MAKCKHLYRARNRAPFTDADAQLIGQILEGLEDRDEMFKARKVLEHARDPRSPLHKYFEWDDNKAAEAYRLEQAGRLVAFVTIEVVDASGNKKRERAYHSITISEADGSKKRGFMSIRRIKQESDLQEQLVQRALQTLRVWRDMYHRFQRFHELIVCIDQILADVAAASRPANKAAKKAASKKKKK